MPARRFSEMVIPAGVSPEEAAAIVAALERFLRDTAQPSRAPADEPDAWWRAGIREAVEHEAPAELREPWMTG
jgi:hypothetical protein